MGMILNLAPIRGEDLAAVESDGLLGLEGATDLDKAWHGIHFLLTGEPWAGDGPGAFLLSGGAVQESLEMGWDRRGSSPPPRSARSPRRSLRSTPTC